MIRWEYFKIAAIFIVLIFLPSKTSQKIVRDIIKEVSIEMEYELL